MIKNKTAKMVGAAMAAALMFGTVAPITVNANGLEVNSQKGQYETSNEEQFDYALEEFTLALELLDNANLTDLENYKYMMAYASAAKARLELLESDELVDDINSTIANEIFPKAEIALRLMNDMRCLQQASEETKQAWIDALNEAITYARINDLANYETLRAATDVLHTEAGVVVEESKVQENNFDREQYEYARVEVERAIKLLDHANLTDRDNYDAMMAYTSAAKNRLDLMESNEYVDALYSKIYDEIVPSANVALRLMNDMICLQEANAQDKGAWIDALNEAITYARINNLTNYETLRAATDVLHTEAGVNK